MFAHFQIPLTWTELLKRMLRETQNDNGLGLAAQLAYYFFLALFPALLFTLALISFLAISGLPDRLATYLASLAPPEVATIIRDQLAELWQGRHGGLMTFGFVAALWSSSAALVALIDALEIEHAAAHTLAAGPAMSGRRRMIGARAAQEFRERQHRVHITQPATAHLPVQRAPRPEPCFARFGALFGGLISALSARRVRR
jgi:Virulence factor BrkB